MSGDSDMRAVEAAQLTRSIKQGGKGARHLEVVEGRLVYSFNVAKAAAYADAALAPGVPRTPWQVSADLLWSVDHLVRELPSEDVSADDQDGRTPRRRGQLVMKQEAARRFTFDYREAERQVARGLRARASITQAAREPTRVHGNGIEGHLCIAAKDRKGYFLGPIAYMAQEAMEFVTSPKDKDDGNEEEPES